MREVDFSHLEEIREIIIASSLTFLILIVRVQTFYCPFKLRSRSSYSASSLSRVKGTNHVVLT